MLYDLDIKNIAVIEDISFSPGKGANVLTGETGAGKSVIIDSVNLLLGARANKDLIRYGAPKATVSALFSSNEAISALLDENGIEPGEDIVISREISPDGRSVARINGSMVPLSLLKELSHLLINIHGQHDSQALLMSEKHIDFLDSYAGAEEVVSEYKKEYQALKALIAEKDALSQNEQDRLARADLLKYQTDELSSASLSPGEEEALKEEKAVIENAEKISDGVNKAYEYLFGGEQNAYDSLSMAHSALSGIEGYDGVLSELFSRLADALYSAEDIAHELLRFSQNAQYDEQRLDEISQRLDLIKKLERKYGPDIPSCIAYLEKASAELDILQNSDERLEMLSREIDLSRKRAEEIAKKLSGIRVSAAKKLSCEIEEELHGLDMEKARFFVSVKSGKELTKNGFDSVEFMFSANPGQPEGNLSRIASGGELSRVMLAMKSVLAEADDVDTLIFDEIDTGVSGSAAAKIAKKIALLGKKKQIICISHQPRIAAAADCNFKIEKHIENNVTKTTITLLDHESRIRELARMTGGEDITKTSLDHAREMLEKN